MPEQIIRFGISDGCGRRAATWRVWTPEGKSDIYLACRELKGALKASLHQSGRWHVAYEQKTFKEYVDGAIPTQKNRFLEKWPRPKSIAPGVTLAFRIVTPYSSVTSPVSEAKKNVAWLPNCPPGHATEVFIIILSPTTLVSGWPGKKDMGTKLVRFYRLPNGESVWVEYLVIKMPDLSGVPEVKGQFFRGRTREVLKSDNLRAIAFDEKPDGSMVVYDFAVKGIGS